MMDSLPKPEPEEVAEEQEELSQLHQSVDLESMEGWPFDYKKARTMRKGAYVKRQYSMTEEWDSAFRDFLEHYTGMRPTRGKGIASTILEVFIRIGIAVVAEFKLQEIAKELRELIINPVVLKGMSENLRRMADLIEETD
jgi:hypothetical protein